MSENSETKLVKLTIDGEVFDVPEGMNLVDAAKQVGNDIPVFCYHPKLGAAANCRMCLVELGAPRPNRQTGELELAWFPGVQTACTHSVRDGMEIKTTTDLVVKSRKEILEFLLSSHPLDCPICDKGGECPLQNLTMEHGPGTSRMYWTDKMRLGKHIPLGEVIYLDQERCIHCARCIRFQDIIVDDPVLSFDYRGRKQRIITNSKPGFDSIWSGNTTDICPVGALTTADFRFNARPWEMVAVASLCTHSPVGANIVYDTRTDRLKGGRTTIRRIMPRQNEEVNETWISDKTRFVHHYMESDERLTQPMMRQNGQLVPVSWNEALQTVVSKFKNAGSAIGAIAGPRLSNEDYYAIQKLIRGLGSSNLSVYPARAEAGDIVAEVGVGVGTNLKNLGEGDVAIVVASDLLNEAPLWWLQLKQASERGAKLIVLNGRPTRLDKFAAHSIRYTYGEEVAAVQALTSDSDEVAKVFAEADNAMIFVGTEGLNAGSSRAVAQAAANALIETGHVGKALNGLVVVWPGANIQGAFDMGMHHAYGPGYEAVDAGMNYTSMVDNMGDLKLLYLAGADPVFDDGDFEAALKNSNTAVIMTDLLLSETAEKYADIVLPVQSISERDGTYTNAMRRIQRFYPAIDVIGESKQDFVIAQEIGQALGIGDIIVSLAPMVFSAIAKAVGIYNGMTYTKLGQVKEQFPDVRGEGMYYGGTQYENKNGLGAQWQTVAERNPSAVRKKDVKAENKVKANAQGLIVVPTTLLYDREPVFQYTELLHKRIAQPHLTINPADAETLGVTHGDMVGVSVNGHTVNVSALISEDTPQGVTLMPRRLQPQGAPVAAAGVPLTKLEKAEA